MHLYHFEELRLLTIPPSRIQLNTNSCIICCGFYPNISVTADNLSDLTPSVTSSTGGGEISHAHHA